MNRVYGLIALIQEAEAAWDFDAFAKDELEVYRQRCDVGDGGIVVRKDGRDRGLWLQEVDALRDARVLLTWDKVRLLTKALTKQEGLAKVRLAEKRSKAAK
jgi:hypothetical protein